MRIGDLAAALGKGLMAGAVGTAAMTLSSTLEAKLRDRESSSAPADAAAKVLGVKPEGEAEKARFSNLVHWGYGTGWGAVRGLLAALGLTGPNAAAAHFSAVWGSELVMLPALEVVPPVREWGGPGTLHRRLPSPGLCNRHHPGLRIPRPTLGGGRPANLKHGLRPRRAASTSAQGATTGFCAQLLAHHAHDGRFERVRRGLYRLRDYPAAPHEEIHAAWLAMKDRAVVWHESALELHGLSHVIADRVHLTISRY